MYWQHVSQSCTFCSAHSNSVIFLYSYSIIQSCWEELADKRPSFSELVVDIDSTLESMAGYMDLNVLSIYTSENGYDHFTEDAVCDTEQNHHDHPC